MSDPQVVADAWAVIDKALKRHVAELEPNEVEAWGLLRHFVREMVTPTFILSIDKEVTHGQG